MGSGAYMDISFGLFGLIMLYLVLLGVLYVTE